MIKLSLSAEEINTILNALGNLPYVQVYQLIQKIQEQATPQLQAMQNGQEEKAKETAMEPKP